MQGVACYKSHQHALRLDRCFILVARSNRAAHESCTLPSVSLILIWEHRQVATRTKACAQSWKFTVIVDR
jgi:hypothetical protein